MFETIRKRFTFRAAVAGLIALVGYAVANKWFDGTEFAVVLPMISAAGYAILGVLGPQEPSIGVQWDVGEN